MSAARKLSIEEELAKLLGKKSNRVWPPTKTTRDAIIKQLVRFLSETFQIPTSEADVIVCRLEEEAFTAAGSSSAPAARIFDVYIQEMHDRLMEYSRKIWPPPQGMRDAVVQSLITTFSAILRIPITHADVIIRQVEEEAFNVISASSGAAAGEDGMTLYMAYYKESLTGWLGNCLRVSDVICLLNMEVEDSSFWMIMTCCLVILSIRFIKA